MILNLIKPKGLTSHDLVNRVRHITGERKVGHGGTLDPLAEGVLVVGVGRESTRKLNDLLKNADKEYLAVIELGVTSNTDDSEGKLQITGDVSKVTRGAVEQALKKFTGHIKQMPPEYSAIKIGGTPAYKLARRGVQPELTKRSVHVKSIELVDFNPPQLTIRVVTSSGTYIRSLARDIGEYLEVGGYLKQLTRTRVGDFHLNQGTSIDQLAKEYKMGNTNRNET